VSAPQIGDRVRVQVPNANLPATSRSFFRLVNQVPNWCSTVVENRPLELSSLIQMQHLTESAPLLRVQKRADDSELIAAPENGPIEVDRCL
jgi:hypothetical protein